MRTPVNGLPQVDVNLFVYNGEATLGSAIESVLTQTWPALTLTVIDNCSTDATASVLAGYARESRVRIRRNRANVGPVLNCQRAFWEGDADFVMPKTADDLLAPEFIERVMGVLMESPECVMCHAGGLVFTGSSDARAVYPASHRLSAIGADPVQRACHVMSRYTTAPSFWGIYRRAAVDRLTRIAYRAGWDHAVLAELALYGEIRHVPETLFWRRDGGKPVQLLAPACTEAVQRGLGLDDVLSEHRWRTPLTTTAYAHIETFAVVPLDAGTRRDLMGWVPRIFQARWGAALQQEANAFRRALRGLIDAMAGTDRVTASWMARQLSDAVRAVETILPGQDFVAEHLEIAALAGEAGRRAAA